MIDELSMDFAAKTFKILQMDAVFLIQFANSLVLKFARLNVQIKLSMDTITALSIVARKILWVLIYVSGQESLLVKTNMDCWGK